VFKCQLCDSNSLNVVPYSGKDNVLKITEIIVCETCGFGMAKPMPRQRQLDEFYRKGSYWNNSKYDKHLESHNRTQADYRASWVRTFLKKERVHALDIGAGTGAMLEALGSKFSLLAYDFIEPDINLAAYIKSRDTEIAKDLPSLEASRKKYDVIFLNHVVEHMVDPMEFLKSIKSKLTEEGIVYIEVPHNDYKKKDDVFPHTLFFTPDSLFRMVSKTGFNVLEIKTFGKLPGLSGKDRLLKLGFRVSIRFKSRFLQTLFAKHLFHYDRVSDGIWLRAILSAK